MSARNGGAAAEVDQVLARAGLRLAPDDRERLIRAYPIVQGMMHRLRLPEARYAEPALIYPALVRE